MPRPAHAGTCGRRCSSMRPARRRRAAASATPAKRTPACCRACTGAALCTCASALSLHLFVHVSAQRLFSLQLGFRQPACWNCTQRPPVDDCRQYYLSRRHCTQHADGSTCRPVPPPASVAAAPDTYTCGCVRRFCAGCVHQHRQVSVAGNACPLCRVPIRATLEDVPS